MQSVYILKCFNKVRTTEFFLPKVNPFPNKPWFLRVCSTSLLKTLWEKEKLLVTSNFSFSHSVFYPFEEVSAIFIKFVIVVCKVFQFGQVNNFSFGKGLTNFSFVTLWLTRSLGNEPYSDPLILYRVKCQMETIQVLISLPTDGPVC